jgi:flagellar hook-length control protein FliK
MTAAISRAAHQAPPHAPVAPRALADKGAPAFSSVMEAVLQKRPSGASSEAGPTLALNPTSGAEMFDRAIVRNTPAGTPQPGDANAGAIDRARPPASPSPIANAQPVVRELDLTLTPPGLGALALKMRMIEGRLSIVMEVANADALKAAQGQRDAISASLAAHAQPLESLVIRKSETPQQQGQDNYARNSRRDAREGAQDGSSNARREPFSGRRDPARAPPRWRRADDLLV